MLVGSSHLCKTNSKNVSVILDLLWLDFYLIVTHMWLPCHFLLNILGVETGCFLMTLTMKNNLWFSLENNDMTPEHSGI